MHIKVLSAIE